VASFNQEKEREAMSEISRRSFLGGFLASLAAWLGGKNTVSQVGSAPPLAAQVTPPVTMIRDPLGSVTTSTYDYSGNLLHSVSSGTTYTYDAQGRLTSQTDHPNPIPWIDLPKKQRPPDTEGEPPAAS
jgi:YD repeat-containing protein